MSIYHDLNDVQLDLSQYVEMSITELEQQKWKNRVMKKLVQRKKNRPSRWIGIASVIVLGVGITLSLSPVSLAQIPFVGGLIEKFINAETPLDYTPYKTAIGESAENSYGKLTLNEVLIDRDRLLISATFEPAKGIKFDYQTQLHPKVLINGERLELSNTSQTIEEQEGTFTLYGESQLSHLPSDTHLDIQITYDTISYSNVFGMGSRHVEVTQPWVFDIEASQAQMTKETKILELNKQIKMNNGEQITIKKIILTPVSTLVYFDGTGLGDDNMLLKLESSKGERIPLHSSSVSNEQGSISYIRFGPIDYRNQEYYLIPTDNDARTKELGEKIEVNTKVLSK